MSDGKINTLPRKIKFRIWNNKTRSWVHGPHKNPSLDGVNLFGETIMFGYLLHGVSIEDYNECIPLQYTGLKDRSGREIFEGDIVCVMRDCGNFDESRYEKMNLPVKYYPDRGFKAYWGHEDCNAQDLYSAEVIGNIFENPELLTP